MLEFEVVRQGPLVRRHGHARHHLHATAHSQAVVVHRLLCSHVYSAQARGAVAVDAQAGNLVAPASPHQGEFGDVGTLIGGLRDAADDGVTHLGCIDAGLLGQCLELPGQQIHGFEAAQRAFVIASPPGGAQGFDDESLAHAVSLG